MGIKAYLNKIGISEQNYVASVKILNSSICPMHTDTGDLEELRETHRNKNRKKLGYLFQDQNCDPVNTLIVITKKYIFESSKLNAQLHLSTLLHKIKQHFIEIKLLASLNNKEMKFDKTWDIWYHLFDSE